MNGNVATHSIRVLGRDLQVKSAASAQHVEEVAALVNAKLSEAQTAINSGDTQLAVILALMNIAEAYLTATKEHEEGKQALDQRLADLLKLMDAQAG